MEVWVYVLREADAMLSGVRGYRGMVRHHIRLARSDHADLEWITRRQSLNHTAHGRDIQ